MKSSRYCQLLAKVCLYRYCIV